MTWFQGTTTGYTDLLDQVEQIATARSVVSQVITAAGTGYSVGDIITLTAGTFTHAAQFEVTTLSGSTVTGVRVYSGGAYSVDPAGASATTVAPSGGTGCTITLTNGVTGWTMKRSITDRGATVVAIVAGGTGYTVNDVLTVSGGTAITATTLTVTSVSSGVIDGVSVAGPGQYLEGNEPSNAVAVTGGTGGDDATFNLTFQGEDGRQQLILDGLGSGSDNILVGMNSNFDSGSGTRNWELKGFTGHDESLSWLNQVGINPGDVNTGFQSGAFFPLTNGAMTWWMNMTSRRIMMVASVGATYSSMHAGLLNPFATTTEFPYPIYIAGSASSGILPFNSSAIQNSSICDPISGSSSDTFYGPGQLRLSSGSWVSCKNSNFSGTGNGRDPLRVLTMYPAGQSVASTPNQAPVLTDDRVVTRNQGQIDFTGIVPNDGNPGTQGVRLLPTPNAAGDLSVPIPCTVMLSDTVLGLGAMGEVDSLYWISADQSSTIVSEDRVTIGSDRYVIFQSGLRTELFSFFCVKEE